jgi:hypothetical protein
MRLRFAGCLALVVVLCGGRGDAQSPSRAAALIDLAGAYVQRFVDRFSNVVAEEQYVQETTAPRRKRTLKSDFLLVRFPGATEWHMFRDVFEVDGKSVRAEQEGRLAKLFLAPAEDALRRAADIRRAGAQYNLRDIGTLNNPLLALAYLQPGYRARFRFTLGGLQKSLGPEVRTVRFEEWQRPTVLRDNANGDLFSRGLMWIDGKTGVVVKTELEVGQQRAPPEIVTLFQFDEALGINVPVEMRDWYPDSGGEIRGTARYGRFRRFQVRTDEDLAR